MCSDLLSVIAVYRLDGLEGQSVHTMRCDLNHIQCGAAYYRHHGVSPYPRCSAFTGDDGRGRAYPQCPPFTGHRVEREKMRRAPGDGGGLH